MHSDPNMTGEKGKDLNHYLSLMGRNKFVLGACAAAGALLSFAVLWVLPDQYESSATIIIEDPEVPPKLIGSTVTSFAEKRLELIDQRIMTTRNLSRIIKEFDLYPEMRETGPMLPAIERLRSDFELEKVSAQLIDPESGRHRSALISFNLTYRNPSPEAAQKVTRELARLYLTYNVSERRQQASQAAEFLADEATRLAQRVDALEDELTAFKQTHPGFVAGQGEVLLDLVDRTETQIRETDRRISELNDRKLVLQRELDIALSQTGNVDGFMTLPQMRAELQRISQIYEPNHPDIVVLKRRIQAARSDRGPDANGADSMNIGMLINPEAARVQAQLETVAAEKSRLRKRKAELETKLEKLEAKAMASPELEQKYLELQRDYENAKAQYDETKKKQLVADQASVLEKSRKGERFTLLEPPQVPRHPAGPPDELVIAGGSAGSFMLALVVLLLMDVLDRRIHSSRQLEAVIGMEPIMLIPVLRTRAERTRQRRMWPVSRFGDGRHQARAKWTRKKAAA